MHSLKERQRALCLENPWPLETNTAPDPYKWSKTGQAAPEKAQLTVVICLLHHSSQDWLLLTTQLEMTAKTFTHGRWCLELHMQLVIHCLPQSFWWLAGLQQAACEVDHPLPLSIFFRKKEVLLLITCRVKNGKEKKKSHRFEKPLEGFWPSSYF